MTRPAAGVNVPSGRRAYGRGGRARHLGALGPPDMRRPVPAVAAAVAVLALAALPVGSVKYGIDLGTASLTGRPSAEAQNVLARSFEC